MFLTTHYIDEADVLSDRILVIDQGCIVAADTADNLKAQVAGDLVDLEAASGILLPMTIGPTWLEKASDFMPIRHVVDAVRSSFGRDFASSGIVGHSVVTCPVRRRRVVGDRHVPQGERLTSRPGGELPRPVRAAPRSNWTSPVCRHPVTSYGH